MFQLSHHHSFCYFYLYFLQFLSIGISYDCIQKVYIVILYTGRVTVVKLRHTLWMELAHRG